MKSLKGWTIDGVLIGFDQARIIHELFNSASAYYCLPIRDWLFPFGIIPSRRNGAEKTFRVYFFDSINVYCKMSNVRDRVIAIASKFRVIAFDYPKWVRYCQEITFLLVNQKRGLLPKDVAKMIILYL